MLVKKRREDPLPIQLIHITSRNRPAPSNALLMEINIIFGINTNSSSADSRESTNLNSLSDFTKKLLLILEIAS